MPRTVRVKLYKFSELSDSAKEKALDDYRAKGYDYAWGDENRQSMEAFAEIFPIKVTNWSYGGRGEGVSFHFTSDEDAIENLSGQRLATYIWNNYKKDIYKGKYYDHLSVRDEPIRHKRVRAYQISAGPNKGKYSGAYHSAITLDNCCVLTGYAMDDTLLNPIYDFMKKPDSRTFKDLLEDCFGAWIKACNDDLEHQNSDEYIADLFEANQYEFTKDGKQY